MLRTQPHSKKGTANAGITQTPPKETNEIQQVNRIPLRLQMKPVMQIFSTTGWHIGRLARRGQLAF